MKTSLIMMDDFAPLPEMLRRRAMASDFRVHEFQGAEYKGVGSTNQPTDMAPRISRALGFEIKIAGSFFRLGTPDNEPTTYIHADRNCADWACVLYLNPPDQCRGGTAFWKHRETGADNIQDHCAHKTAHQKAIDYDAMNREGNDESCWEMTGLAGMKFNRFIAYRSDLFHSRYPQAGWGVTPQDGRLIWTAFCFAV